MARMHYMALYVDDFEAATAHLTLEEDGAYNRLLRLCWRTSGCSVPDDPTWIARRLRIDLETYHRLVDPLIKEFFTKDQSRVFQKRQRAIWSGSVETSDKRAAAGKKGGRGNKSPETNEKDESPAKANEKPGRHSQSQSQIDIEIEEEDASLRGKILSILGLGFAVPLTSRWSDLPEAITRWQTEFELEDDEIIEVVRRVMSRPRAKPERPSYFDKAMHDLAMKKMGIPTPFRKATA